MELGTTEVGTVRQSQQRRQWRIPVPGTGGWWWPHPAGAREDAATLRQWPAQQNDSDPPAAKDPDQISSLDSPSAAGWGPAFLHFVILLTPFHTLFTISASPHLYLYKMHQLPDSNPINQLLSDLFFPSIFLRWKSYPLPSVGSPSPGTSSTHQIYASGTFIPLTGTTRYLSSTNQDLTDSSSIHHTLCTPKSNLLLNPAN